ncbi:hypothetical protein [Streptosporangium jomthongense]|uniref:Uncharacterized protein n=1 Tax=Streptosporangium jomthongense TaxID=1193683 RepID=A0ABV8FEK2_9ACTN
MTTWTCATAWAAVDVPPASASPAPVPTPASVPASDSASGSVSGSAVSTPAAGPVPGPGSAAPAPEPGSAPACKLVNGGFEEPGSLHGQGNLRSGLPGWSTSADDGLIEIWGPDVPSVRPDTGRQFAEVNGTATATLSQDVRTVPGATLTWHLAHRGRSAGEDVLQLRIGGVTQVPMGQNTSDIADDNAGWGHYTGRYSVPPGQTVTRFEFVSISTAGDQPDQGNLLDSVEISCEPPCVRNVPPTSPYLLLTGPANSELTGGLSSSDPEGGEITYLLDGAASPQVSITSEGRVTLRPMAPAIWEVPVKACDRDGSCTKGRIVAVISAPATPAVSAPAVSTPTGPAVSTPASTTSTTPATTGTATTPASTAPAASAPETTGDPAERAETTETTGITQAATADTVTTPATLAVPPAGG